MISTFGLWRSTQVKKNGFTEVLVGTDLMRVYKYFYSKEKNVGKLESENRGKDEGFLSYFLMKSQHKSPCRYVFKIDKTIQFGSFFQQ